MPLLYGTADLILLFVVAWALQERVESAWQWCMIGGFFASIYSALPFGVYIIAYLIATSIAKLLKRRVWKAPYLSMLAATFVGTLVVHLIAYIARIITGVDIPLINAFNLILLPGLLLNLLLAVPVYSITHDLAGWLYPEELEA
jgi:rod shape-determining protein MreD